MTFAPWVDRHGPGITSALAVAGALFFWLLPGATSCHTTASGATTCGVVSLAASLGNPGLAAVLLAASVAFCLLPYLLAFSAAAQFVWAGVVLAFYIVSFGVDGPLLPAAASGIVTGFCMLAARRPPPDETAFPDVSYTVPDKLPPADEADREAPSVPPNDSEGPATPPEDGGAGSV